jgi:hypothetical protein
LNIKLISDYDTYTYGQSIPYNKFPQQDIAYTQGNDIVNPKPRVNYHIMQKNSNYENTSSPGYQYTDSPSVAIDVKYLN